MSHPLQGQKVISASEMKKIEKLAFSEGEKEDVFMENAGREVATFIERESNKRNIKTIIFFLGKGNNAGDGACACSHLIKKGFNVNLGLNDISFSNIFSRWYDIVDLAFP